MRTAKEKATELYNLFYDTSSHPFNATRRRELAIKYSLICCNQVLGDMGSDRGYEFWTEVKRELENIKG